MAKNEIVKPVSGQTVSSYAKAITETKAKQQTEQISTPVSGQTVSSFAKTFVDPKKIISSTDVNADGELDIRDLVRAKKMTENSSGQVKVANESATKQIKDTLLSNRYLYMTQTDSLIKKIKDGIALNNDEINSLNSITLSALNDSSVSDEEKKYYKNLYDYSNDLKTKSAELGDIRKSALYYIDMHDNAYKGNNVVDTVFKIAGGTAGEESKTGLEKSVEYAQEYASYKYGDEKQQKKAYEKLSKIISNNKASDEDKEEYEILKAALGKSANFADYHNSVWTGGIGRIKNAVVSGADFFYNAIPRLFGKEDIVDYSKDIESIQNEINRAQSVAVNYGGGSSSTGGKISKIAYDVTSNAVAMIPTIILGSFSGGTTTVSSLANETSSMSYLKNLVKNPVFWTAAAEEFASSYSESYLKGEDMNLASLKALIIGAINGAIEIGSGVEARLGENSSLLKEKTWEAILNSAKEEGLEEGVQGGISTFFDFLFGVATNNATGDKNAYDNPKELLLNTLYEMGIGSISGALMTSGTKSIESFFSTNSETKITNLGENVIKNKRVDDLIKWAEAFGGENIQDILDSPGYKNDAYKIGKLQLAMYESVINSFNIENPTAETLTNVLRQYAEIIPLDSSLYYGTVVSQYDVAMQKIGVPVKEIAKLKTDVYTSVVESQNSQEMSNPEIAVDYNSETNENAVGTAEDVTGGADAVNDVAENEDGYPKFREPDRKEIYREPTKEEFNKGIDNVKRHISDVAQKYDPSLKIEYVSQIHGKNHIATDKLAKYVKSTNTMYIRDDITLKEAYVELFKHEFMHSLEKKKLYNDFKNYVLNRSKAFENYARFVVRTQSGEDSTGTREDLLSALTEVYEKIGYTKAEAEYEMIADFFGKCLLQGKEGRAEIASVLQDETSIKSLPDIDADSELDILGEMAKKEPNLLKRFWEFVKGLVAKVKGEPRFKTLTEDLEYLDKYVERLINSSETKNIDKSNGNDVKFKIDNEVKENGTNSEVLGKETISTVSRSGNNVREQSSNTEKLKGYMGVLRTSNQDKQNISAGENGWMSQTIRKKFSVNSFHKLIASLRGNVQGRQILSTDSVGRILNKDIQNRFSKTIFADKDGKIFSLYHWTKSEFSKFEKGEFGFHFGTLEASNDIRKVKSDPNITGIGIYKEVYLNITNPLYCDVDGGIWSAYDIAYHLTKLGLVKEVFLENIERMNGAYDGTYDNPAANYVRQYLKQLGYDGIIYQNEQEDIGSFSAIALYADQILVVAENGILKDNTGVSEASDEGAFSMPKTDSNEKFSSGLMEQLRYNSKEYAKRMLRKYGIRNDTYAESVAESLDEIVKLYNKGGKNISEAEYKLDKLCIDIAESMPNTVNEWSKEIIDYVKGTVVSVNETQKSEILNSFNSLREFQKETGIKISDDSNTSLDEQWQEWAEEYPGYFDSDTNEGDQPSRLYDIIDNAKNDFEERDSIYMSSQIKGQILNDIENTGVRAENIRIENAKKYGYKLGYDAAFKESGLLKDYIKEKVKKKTLRNINHLDTLLYANENQRHIPEGLKGIVNNFMTVFVSNDDTGIFNSGKNKQRRKRFYTPIDHLETDNVKEYREACAENFYNAFTTYLSDNNIEDLGSETIKELISEFKEFIPGKKFSSLTEHESEIVYDISEYINKLVNGQNEAFVNGKKVEIQKLGRKVINELEDIKSLKLFDTLGVAGAESFRQMLVEGNMPPYYLFKRLGPTFETLYWDLIEGQNKTAKLLDEASDVIAKIKKENNFAKWKNDIKTVMIGGKTYALTVGQLQVIYATKMREMNNEKQNAKHTKVGGIVFDRAEIKNTLSKVNALLSKKNSKDVVQSIINRMTSLKAQAIKVNEKDLENIMEALTFEQMKYADDIVEFMSTWCADKGNEVTLALYGIKKYNETYYFPYNSASNYLSFNIKANNQQIMKSPSFSKNLQAEATSPLLVTDFTDIALSHINRMISYNAFSVPLDTLNRLLNYDTGASVDYDMNSVQSQITNTYGDGMVSVLKNFILDCNNGVVREQKYQGVSWLISKFRKNAVMASLSVWIQQPTAYARASALIDIKYLLKSKAQLKAMSPNTKANLLEEMYEYAPIAIVKAKGALGGMKGANDLSWLKGSPYETKLEKVKGFFSLSDSSVRDETFGFLAEKGDEVTWRALWLAVKDETKAEGKYKYGSKEFLEACGKRFTEIIVKTQVYDSVLSRSQNLRDTGLLGSAMSFMQEPTLTAAMATDSVLNLAQAKTKSEKVVAKKALVKTFGALVFNIILNATAKSLIYAGRDDDEDKSIYEKYINKFVENVLNDSNPLGYLPWVKDALSVFDGYSVERADMSVLSDVVDGIKKAIDEDADAKERIRAFAEALGAVVDVPIKNIFRDIEGTARSVYSFWNDNFPDLVETRQALFESLPFYDSKKTDYYDRLMKAEKSGDTKEYEKLYNYTLEHGYTEEDIQSGKYRAYKTSSSVEEKTDKAISQKDKAYKKLSEEHKEDVEKNITSYFATEEYLKAKKISPKTFDDIYTQKRKNKTAYDKQKADLIKNGMSEYDFNKGIEYAKVRYMKSIGVDIESYFSAKKLTSKSFDYADLDNNGKVTTFEQRTALKKLGYTDAQIRAILN